MSRLVDDAPAMAAHIARALDSSGYRADFSPESLDAVERFFAEQCRDGHAIPGGLLADDLGKRLFAIGCYVGETLRRAGGGTWWADDADPDGEVNIEVRFPGGSRIWPVQRVMKRFHSGSCEAIDAYGASVLEYRSGGA